MSLLLLIIIPALGFTKLLDADFLTRLLAILAGMTGNPAYPTPPVSMADFKAAIDIYSAAISAALNGGRKAINDRRQARDTLIVMVRALGHYVESACKGDMATFLSSGFQAAPTTRTPPQPLDQPTLTRVDPGISGQLLAYIKPVARARNYEVHFAPLSAGIPGTWATLTVASARSAAAINGLTPGTTYAVQVRAFGKLGFTEWSDSVNRMST